MPFRIEHLGPGEILVRPLAVSAVDGQMGEDPETGEPRPLVLVAMGVKDDLGRLEENYYALSGQDVILLLGALRAAGVKVFGQGFAHTAEIVAALDADDLESWLSRGADLRLLGE